MQVVKNRMWKRLGQKKGKPIAGFDASWSRLFRNLNDVGCYFQFMVGISLSLSGRRLETWNIRVKCQNFKPAILHMILQILSTERVIVYSFPLYPYQPYHSFSSLFLGHEKMDSAAYSIDIFVRFSNLSDHPIYYPGCSCYEGVLLAGIRCQRPSARRKLGQMANGG